MAVYINSIGQIAPNSLANEEQIIAGKLTCIEPDYSAFFDSRTLRRISRIIKIGTTSAMMALKNATVEMPDAIIVGTGFGCQEDTSLFLRKLITNKEETLNPTPFIFSTHNSIASQIALQLKCHAYNSTYSHRNFSFESALLDAYLLIKDDDAQHVLVGGVDEIIDDSFDLFTRIGYLKPTDIAGEGASFFVLSDVKSKDCVAELKSIEFVANTEIATIIDKAKTLYHEYSIDAIIVGSHPDHVHQNDQDLIAALKIENTIFYKQLCGEYATSSAYAFATANTLLKENKAVKNVLIYNQYANSNHSLILLSAC